MAQTSANREQAIIPQSEIEYGLEQVDDRVARENAVAKVALLWAQRRFLFRAAMVGLIVGLLTAFLLPRRYESTARLMPPDNTSSTAMAAVAALSGKPGSTLGGIAGSLLGLQTSGAVFVGVLQSRTVQDRLVTRFDLKKVYSIRLTDKARKKLAENTNIAEDRKSGIISITVTDGSPQRAAALAQSYVEELNRLMSEVNTSAAHRERVFLEERLRSVKQDLEASEREFSQFASKNTAIDIKEQGKAMVEAAATLQGQLIAAQAQLEGLRQTYTDSNARVREVQARVAELQHQLLKLGGGKGGPATSTDEASAADSMFPSIRALPLLGVTYADLYRRTKVAEAVFELLTQQYELAKVQEAKEIPSVKVLDAPNTPERRSFPPRLLVTLLIGVLAVSAAIGWVLGKARWESIDSADPWKAFAIQVGNSVHNSRWRARIFLLGARVGIGRRNATLEQRLEQK